MTTETADGQSREELNRQTEPDAEKVPFARPSPNPLGPVIEVKWLQRPVVGRLYAAGLFLTAAALLGTAAWLAPAKEHMGTHQQLRLLPCGFVTMTGYPCPTCGMTTAFAHAVRGHLIESARSQPAGLLLALVATILGLSAAGAVTTGRYPTINWYRINPTSFVWWVAGTLVAAWGVKTAMGLLDGTLPAK